VRKHLGKFFLELEYYLFPVIAKWLKNNEKYLWVLENFLEG
jgi:hypothetical protein